MASVQSSHLPNRATRLEKEAEFLLYLSKCKRDDYFAAVNSATEEQLKAVLECLRNFERFHVHLKAKAIKEINKILQLSFDEPEAAKQTFIKKKRFIQATLANIFLKIILAEFHYIFCM